MEQYLKTLRAKLAGSARSRLALTPLANPTNTTSLKAKAIGAMVVVGVLVGLGFVVTHIRASGKYISSQPESGSTSGSISIIQDPNASGSSAIRFGSSAWKPLALGAGGWLTGIDMVKVGTVTTRVVRTDTYGAYIWDEARSLWRQLVTSSSLPAADVAPYSGVGVYEIAISPKDPTKLYMAWNGTVYVSTNSGATWRGTGLSGHATAMEPNDSQGYRIHGHKMAIDPNNDEIAYAGVPGLGVFKKNETDLNWTMVPTSSIPAVGGQGYTGMLFDRSGGSANNRTNVMYIHAEGRGYYRTTNGGASWSLLAGSPSHLEGFAIDPTGVLYASDSTNVYKYTPSTNTWRTILAGTNSQMHSIAIDPLDKDHIVLGRDSGHLRQSFTGGIDVDATHPAWDGDYIWSQSRLATDIPWLAWTGESYMSNGAMQFDPNGGSLWFAEGIGVWTTSNTTRGSASVTWSSKSKGIEQLVVNDIIAPPGEHTFVGVEDRGVMELSSPDTFPSTHAPDSVFNANWDLDYSPFDPTYIASDFSDTSRLAASYKPGYSTVDNNGTRHWYTFPAKPYGAITSSDYGFGAMAVSRPGNIVWIAANYMWPNYTTDGGSTWHPITITSPAFGPDANHKGSGFSDGRYFLDRHTVASDRVTAGKFYLINFDTNGHGGLYTSTDSNNTPTNGASWRRVFGVPSQDNGQDTWATFYYSGNNTELQAVPNNAGHLYLTAGQSGSTPDVSTPDNAMNFLRSTDGGASWRKVGSAGNVVKEVYKFGFGKPMPGSTYPTIFIAGWVNNQFGIWRSADQGDTWTNLGTFPGGSIDSIRTVSGDMNIAGRVYVGFAGSGAQYRDSN